MRALVQVRPWDPRFRAYLRLASREWPWVGAVALAACAGGNAAVWVLEQDGEVVAGALLTRRPLNVFRRRSQRALARRLCAEGRRNLAYLAVKRDRRGEGHGRAFIRVVAQRGDLWLACEPSLDGFYSRCELVPSPDDPRFHLSCDERLD